MERKRAAQNKAQSPEEEYVVPKQPQWKQNLYASSASTQGSIVGFLLRRGLAKDESQANMILLGVFVATVALTSWLIWSRGSTTTNPPPLDAPNATTQTAPTP